MGMPEVEEPDLDYGELGLESDDDVEVVARFERTTLQYGRTDWAPVHEALVKHRLAKGRLADGSKAEKTRVESDEEPVTITEAGHEVPWEELPRSPKGYAKRALERGWSVGATRSMTHVAAILFQDDSPEDAKDPHSRGDVRYAAEDREHYGLYLWAGEGQLKARLRYEGRPKRGKEGFDYKLSSAVWKDPFGPREFSTLATEFDDWFDIVVPRATPRKPKRNSPEALLGGEEWRG
jgi:hypothetical protein